MDNVQAYIKMLNVIVSASANSNKDKWRNHMTLSVIKYCHEIYSLLNIYYSIVYSNFKYLFVYGQKSIFMTLLFSSNYLNSDSVNKIWYSTQPHLERNGTYEGFL